MIVKLTPASSDRIVWQIAVPRNGEDVPVDYTHFLEEERSFLGENGGLFEAEPEAEGWRVLGPAKPELS